MYRPPGRLTMETKPSPTGNPVDGGPGARRRLGEGACRYTERARSYVSVFDSDYAAGWVLLAAVFADTVDLEGMAGSLVVVLVADFLLELFDLVGEELNRAAATGADHVVMAASV